MRTLCEVGDSEENFSQGVDLLGCEDDTTTLWRSGATTATAPVAGSLRIGTLNLVPVAKCIGVGLVAVPSSRMYVKRAES